MISEAKSCPCRGKARAFIRNSSVHGAFPSWVDVHVRLVRDGWPWCGSCMCSVTVQGHCALRSSALGEFVSAANLGLCKDEGSNTGALGVSAGTSLRGTVLESPHRGCSYQWTQPNRMRPLVRLTTCPVSNATSVQPTSGRI